MSRKYKFDINEVHRNLIGQRRTVEDVELLILIETHFIARLENMNVTPKYHGVTAHPAGDYAAYTTAITDAHWRRRNWRRRNWRDQYWHNQFEGTP